MLSPDFFNKFINFSKYINYGIQDNDTLPQQNYAEMIKVWPNLLLNPTLLKLN
jgi:hypothetical protein